MEDNLDEVTSAAPGEGFVEVHGTSSGGGKRHVRVRSGNREYSGEVRLSPPPDPILLGGDWNFRLVPTMDNRWGDFRHPPSPHLIGPETRRFRYMEEEGENGTALGWHTSDFDDSRWPRHTFSFGPWWHAIGPFAAGEEPADLAERIIAGEVDPGWSCEAAGEIFHWKRYHYSRLYGHESRDVHQNWGGVEGVSDCFIVFEELAEGRDVSRYLLTTISAEEDGEWDLIVGGEQTFACRIWINGLDALSTESPEPEKLVREELAPGQKLMPEFMQAPPDEGSAEKVETRVTVKLTRGRNTVLLRMVQPLGREIRAYAAFVHPGADPSAGTPPIPRLRWFVEPNGLVQDILPEADRRIGWYRFEAPAGMRAMTLRLDAVSTEVWVDGEPVEMQDDRIELASSNEGVSQVALRVRQKPGCYAGTAFPEPVAFECNQGRIPLGDWCAYALESYSGGAVYSRKFTLDSQHLKGRTVLDLGQVKVSAEVHVNGRSVGIGLARPFRFDITGNVRKGSNDLEVVVYNTLANHYAVGLASRYVYEGQTVSGLLGPVTVQFLAEVIIKAHPLS